MEPTAHGSEEADATHSWLTAAFHQAPVGMAVLTPEARFVEVNEAMCALVGRTREELLGLTLDDLTAAEDSADVRAEREHLIDTGQHLHRGRYRLVHTNGSPVVVSLAVAPLRHDDGRLRGLIVQAEDISDALQREVDLTHLALHDSLTTLANRVLFLDRLEHALGRLRREPSSLALLFLDVDNFKSVNDRYGHEEGDRVLAEAAHRLAGAVRPGDTVARYGGDEFVVLCEGATHTEAAAVARRISERFEDPIEIAGGDRIALSCSVGVAVTESPDTVPQQLLRDADAAMYREKARRSST